MRDIWRFGALVTSGQVSYFIGMNPESPRHETEFNGVIEYVDLRGEHNWDVNTFDLPQVGEWYFRETEQGILGDPHGVWFVDANEDEEFIVDAAIEAYENSRVLN